MSSMLEGKSVLIVEDEEKILDAVSSYFKSIGCNVYSVMNGSEALKIFNDKEVSFVLLDIMLPDMSGLDVCMEIRKTSRVPIVMVTAKVGEEDAIKGLDVGADDYIRKPYSLRELSARMETILRRSELDAKPLYNTIKLNDGDLEIDLEAYSVRKQGKVISLTPNEFNLLVAFMKYPKKVYTREELIGIVMGEDYDGYDRGIDTHIKNLRKKIEDNPKQPIYVVTVHGVGYKLGVDNI